MVKGEAEAEPREWKVVDGEAETDMGGLRVMEDLMSRALVCEIVMRGWINSWKGKQVVKGKAADSRLYDVCRCMAIGGGGRRGGEHLWSIYYKRCHVPEQLIIIICARVKSKITQARAKVKDKTISALFSGMQSSDVP